MAVLHDIMGCALQRGYPWCWDLGVRALAWEQPLHWDRISPALRHHMQVAPDGMKVALRINGEMHIKGLSGNAGDQVLLRRSFCRLGFLVLQEPG